MTEKGFRILHCGDIHIRNLKRHSEYREVFSQLYEKARELEVDIVYVAGDLAHTKTQLSPEYFELATEFLTNLAEIAPTYIIPGNHDGNLRSTSRQDAITPIVEALDNSRLVLLKKSQEVEVADGIVFNHLSIFDPDNWTEPSDYEAVNIALYHGAISGCSTDSGWVMENGEHAVTIFEEFDMAMLGDIHKSNQSMDKEGRYRYSGSLIQQNHGETNDKGFLVWDIKGKDDFTVAHHTLDNPKPFTTLELTQDGKIPEDVDVSENSRLRIVSTTNLPLVTMRRALDAAKTRFKPSSITFLNRAAGKRKELEQARVVEDGDTRDIAVQEKLIKEFLEDYKASESTLDKIYGLNRKYNTVVEEQEEVLRNINWKMKSISWDNLFNYGEENKIDFSKLEGIVGIFGKNYSGKSSIIDSILFTIFNSTSKNERKNLNIINQNKDYAKANIKIEVDNKIYSVTRQCEKYTKKYRGKEKTEAKTDVDFTVSLDGGEPEELNGTSRADTDKKIRKVFGTLDDFLITSMSSQQGALSFINEGSTKRKELLAKFLDLEIFDKKFKMAKSDAADLKGALKRLEGREFDDDIIDARSRLGQNEKLILLQESKQAEKEKELKRVEDDIQLVKQEITAVPTELVDVVHLKKRLQQAQKKLVHLREDTGATREALREASDKLTKADSFLAKFDIDSYKSKEEEIQKVKVQINELLSKEGVLNTSIGAKTRKVELLSEVPCGDQYKSCKFIKDAFEARDAIVVDKDSLASLNLSKVNFNARLEELNPEQVGSYIHRYDKLLSKYRTWDSNVARYRLQLEKNDAVEVSIEAEVQELEKSILDFEKNKEAIENMQSLLARLESLKSDKRLHEINLEHYKRKSTDLYKENGSLEQEIKNLEQEKQELANLREEYSSYDLYMRSMHANGISYDIIKRKLPAINEEIAKILANIVEFEVFFEEEGNKLNIFIKHPKYEPRPLEMGSGAEKTIAAMAIRLALLSVTTLPRCETLIMDEPGTSLDEGNMEGFIQILDMAKTYFKRVILISHLDSLKDCVDMQITIDRKEGYASVTV